MISAVISSMNRTDRLIRMLPTWAKIDEITDIVVVDWSSKDPISEYKNIQEILKNFNKIKIVRVDGQKYFHLGKSYNLGYQFTDEKNKILLKLDVDYLSINGEWIKTLVFQKDSVSLKKYFICGLYRFYKSSSGFLLLNKEDFQRVNGYNENFDSIWGYDDEDIQKRLIQLYEPNNPNFPFRQIFFWNFENFIYHIPHSDELRTENYINNITNNEINKKISEEKPNWSFQKYKIIEKSLNYHKIVME
jgi:predicted glycosyltransferase involved in capsule biosynthesis